MSMLQECDLCRRTVELSEEPDGIAACEHCDRNLCIDCLAKMFIKSGVNASDAAQIRDLHSADGFFRKLEFGHDHNCPECYGELSDD